MVKLGFTFRMHRKMLPHSVGLLVFALLAPLSVSALDLPVGMSFIGLDEEGWYIHLVEDGKTDTTRIENIENPRQVTWSPAAQRLTYIDAEGALIERDLALSKDVVLIDASNVDSYTQPMYSRQGKELWASRFHNRNSESVTIARFSKRAKGFVDVHPQRGANFDPFVDQDYLAYTHVSCVIACGSIIQELWLSELQAKVARQLTRLNAIVRHPVLDSKSNRIVFSSNYAGNYHLWETDLEGASPVQLTKGNVTDTNPALLPDGSIIFIRRSEKGVSLMKMIADGSLGSFDLGSIIDMRDLEINQ